MAAYSTGTITLTNGSDVVTGTGTAWLANAAQGQLLQPLPSPTISLVVYVASVVDNGTLRLESPWAGDSYTGIAYQLVRDFDPLSNAALIPNGNMRPDVLVNRAITSLSQFAATGDKTAAVVVAEGAETSRTLAARFRDRLTPLDWGAVGDGVTDDTSALQAAYNAIVAAGGGCLHLSDKTYRITAPLALFTAVPMKILGPGSIVADFSGASLVALKITHPTAPAKRANEVTIEQVKVSCSAAVMAAGPGPVLLEHLNCSGLRLVKCEFLHYANNSALRLSAMWNTLFHDVYIWGSGCQYVRRQIPPTTTFSIVAGTTALEASAAIFDASDAGKLISLGMQVFAIQSVTDSQNAVTAATAVRTTAAGAATFEGVRGTIASGSATLTLEKAVLSAADVGRSIWVLDAQQVTYPASMLRPLCTTITAVAADGMTVTVAAAATATATNTPIIFSPAVEVLDGTSDAHFYSLQIEQFFGTGLAFAGANSVILQGTKLHSNNGGLNNQSSMFSAVFVGFAGEIDGHFDGTLTSPTRVLVAATSSKVTFRNWSGIVMDDQKLLSVTSSYAGSLITIGSICLNSQVDTRTLATPFGISGSGVLDIDGYIGAYARSVPVITNPKLFLQPVQVQPGSKAVPGVAFVGDVDTGLAQVGGVNTASIITGGTESIRCAGTSITSYAVTTQLGGYVAIGTSSNSYDTLLLRNDATRHLNLTTISDIAGMSPTVLAVRRRATGTVVQSGDTIFKLQALASNGTSDLIVGQISVIQTGVAGANVPGAIVLAAQPASGSTFAQEVVRANGDYTITHRGNVQTIINANSLHVLRSYTLSTLPNAAANAWAVAAVSNGAGGHPQVTSNGANWLYLDGVVAA
ncbi:MAG: hypothetical protein PW843_03390 [Azospirillaceae bacterium]|nr:hypothetical protein [Azospirillaceae bacterium]